MSVALFAGFPPSVAKMKQKIKLGLDLQGGNLESGDGCGFSPAESNIKKMGLAGLKDNGGFTKTHGLKAGSPAIDFGVDGNCSSTDQRGQARIDVPGVGPRICDSGAFEFVPKP